MLRQRLRTRSSPLAFAGRALVVVLALALLWGAAVVVLLAVGVDTATVKSISGYRAVFDFFADLGPGDFDATTRAILAGAGVVCLLVFGYLALKDLARPYLARHDLRLSGDQRGKVVVEPRALERLAEGVARSRSDVADALGRYATDELAVGVAARRADQVPETLRGVAEAVRAELERHGLPATPVHVTLTGYEPKTRREIA